MFAPVPRAYGRVVLQRADLPTDSPPSLPSPPPLSRSPPPLVFSPPLLRFVFLSSPSLRRVVLRAAARRHGCAGARSRCAESGRDVAETVSAVEAFSELLRLSD